MANETAPSSQDDYALLPKRIDNTPRPWWQVFIESSGGAALITVLIGGIIGGAITFFFNRWEKERDEQRLNREAQASRDRLSYEKLLEKKLELARSAFEIAGQSVANTENLLTLHEPGFNFCSTAGVERQIRNEYNDADTAWRRKRPSLGLLLSYYNSNGREVAEKWNKADVTLTGYMNCGSTLDGLLFAQCATKGAPQNKRKTRPCAAERIAVDDALSDLQQALSLSLASQH